MLHKASWSSRCLPLQPDSATPACHFLTLLMCPLASESSLIFLPPNLCTLTSFPPVLQLSPYLSVPQGSLGHRPQARTSDTDSPSCIPLPSILLITVYYSVYSCECSFSEFLFLIGLKTLEEMLISAHCYKLPSSEGSHQVPGQSR